MDKIFITGMSRSGTTLMDRWLGALPGTRIFSQPLPYLFRQAKSAFHESIGAARHRYVFSQFFGDDRYDVADLGPFLDHWKLSPAEIGDCLAEMRGWSGQQSEITDPDAVLPDASVGFFEAISHILRALSPGDAPHRLGLKEILCEEFVPAFVADDWRVILVLRNPLDVLTSIQFGSGSRYVGARRPTLFHLRSWRRSAQVAALMETAPQVHVVRFEDLVRNSEATLRGVAGFLGIDWRDEYLRPTLRDQHGETWTPNTSFASEGSGQAVFNAKAVGRYEARMPVSLQNYIRVICAPEMRYFGYAGTSPRFSAVEDFSEPFRIESDDFEQDFSRRDELDLERVRFETWSESRLPDRALIPRLYIDEEVCRRLAKRGGRQPRRQPPE